MNYHINFKIGKSGYGMLPIHRGGHKMDTELHNKKKSFLGNSELSKVETFFYLDYYITIQ